MHKTTLQGCNQPMVELVGWKTMFPINFKLCVILAAFEKV